MMSSVLRLGKSELPTTPIDADAFERIASCVRVLLEPTAVTQAVFLQQCHTTYATLLASQTVRVYLRRALCRSPRPTSLTQVRARAHTHTHSGSRPRPRTNNRKRRATRMR
jgi:hypothetical protein